MSKDIKKHRGLASEKVWCFDCQSKEPLKITLAAFLVPARKLPYDNGDKLVGICKDCLSKRSQFHQKNTYPVDRDDSRLLYKSV